MYLVVLEFEEGGSVVLVSRQDAELQDVGTTCESRLCDSKTRDVENNFRETLTPLMC